VPEGDGQGLISTNESSSAVFLILVDDAGCIARLAIAS